MTPEQMRKWRRSLGLSQRAAARELEVPRRTYENWEAGAYEPTGCLPKACNAVAHGLPPWSEEDQAMSYRANETIHDTAEEAAGRGVAMNWRPIETAPTDGTEVLLRAKTACYVGSYRRGHGNDPAPVTRAWRASCCGRFTDPTHWAPLPSPPQGDQR
jgi:Predicted transcriptional regulator